MEEERLKAPFGQALAVGVGLLALAAGVLVVSDEGASALLTVCPWLALATGVAWALYWRPEVRVSDAGVRLVNVTRTIDVPWPALRGIETKWALTLDTVWGNYRAWAAPAPGRSELRRQLREHNRAARHVDHRIPGLPANSMARPGDLPSTDSGAAAQIVHERWRRLRDAGHLAGAAVEQERAPVRWHWELFGGAAALIALGTFGLFV